MKYGLLDTKDNVWMGNDDGPLLYSDEIAARLAAQILSVRLVWDAGRIRHRKFKVESLRLRDKVEAVMDAEVAINDMEEGRR